MSRHGGVSAIDCDHSVWRCEFSRPRLLNDVVAVGVVPLQLFPRERNLRVASTTEIRFAQDSEVLELISGRLNGLDERLCHSIVIGAFDVGLIVSKRAEVIRVSELVN